MVICYVLLRRSNEKIPARKATDEVGSGNTTVLGTTLVYSFLAGDMK